MRNYLLCLLATSLLTSCVGYGDLHSQSQPLQLVKTRHSKSPTYYPLRAEWWRQFKDPQLNQLITTALAQSPKMQTAEARVRQAAQFAEGAAATRWPTLDFSGYVQRQRFAKYGLVPPPFNGHTFNIATLGVTFNYEFDLWGKNRQTWMASLNEEYASLADFAEARLVISAAVAATYFQLLGERQQAKLARSNSHLSQQLLQIVNDREQHGVESSIPVKTLQANAEAAKQISSQWQQAVAISEHQLAVLIGSNPLDIKIATKTYSFHHYRFKLPANLPANLLAHRPDIYAAKYRTEAAANRINVAKARFFPDINLIGLFSYAAVGPYMHTLFKPESQNNAVTGAVDLPIFDAGARRANLGVRYAEYDMAVNDYNQILLTALQQVADQLSILKSIQSELSSQDAALSALSNQYKLIRDRYHHGIIDYPTLAQNQQLLIQQQSQQQNLQTRHLLAVVTLLKALGGYDATSKEG